LRSFEGARGASQWKKLLRFAYSAKYRAGNSAWPAGFLVLAADGMPLSLLEAQPSKSES